MGKKLYTKELLISELRRFVLENGRNPKQLDMQKKFGYPSADSYIRNFRTWNKALITAGLEINQIQTYTELDDTEVCGSCGKKANEIPKFQNWLYKNEQRLCFSCCMNRDYMNGNLDPNSSVGFAFMSQRVVAETLGLDLEHDCNCSIGFGAPYDLYDKKLGSINVKAAILDVKNNRWAFGLINKQIPDTYIMLGFANDKSDILHVWITDPLDDLTYKKKAISITNSERGLKRAEYYEVDSESYNNVYHNMSLENCSVLRSD